MTFMPGLVSIHVNVTEIIYRGERDNFVVLVGGFYELWGFGVFKVTVTVRREISINNEEGAASGLHGYEEGVEPGGGGPYIQNVGL